MTAIPTSATLFAYQVGFGDCFLLRLSYDDGTRRHVLIDFGTTGLPKNAPRDQMQRIARDIEAKCREPGGNGLNVIVATHRHQDHISGFSTRADGTGTGDIIAGLNPGVVIQPWTEAPDAPVDWEGPEGSKPGPAFRRHVRTFKAIEATAREALRFVDNAEKAKAISPDLAGRLRFIGEDNLSNLSAVRNLQRMGRRREYVFHGCALDLSDELPGVQVDVLGPPTLRQTETIRRQVSRQKDEFWHLAARRMSYAADMAASKPLFPDAPAFSAKRMPIEYRWLQHRIDETNAELVLSLVRALDDEMNNTSVVLVMRLGGRTLLFPGDAQWENWAYALQSPLAALLDDVDLYKVGHHGSLNATPKSMWNRFRKKGPKSKADRLTSVLSTRKGKHGHDEDNTEVPRRTLVNELKAQSTLHDTEALGPAALCQVIEITLT
ncbi:MAG: hypothetical protein J0M19_01555 [Sphingomonadales bacterium]|nr:hypothetical protein [Sphingomonadales bacterium]